MPVLLILIMNSLIAVIVFVTAFFRKKGQRSTQVMLSWFIFIVPFFGLIYILLGLLFSFLSRKKNIDMNDISFNQEREKIILPPNSEMEMNYVPIQDAMAVSDTSSLRKLLLDTLRNNAKKTVSSIVVAMNSEDTETSHYAASIILDALSECRTTAQNMIEQMQRHPEDVELNLLSLDYFHEILSMKIMNEVEQRSYIYIMDNVAENLFQHNLWYMTATHYLWMTDLFLSIKSYNMADKWASRAGLYRQYMLDTYKAFLHLYFEQQNKTAFFDCLDELRESNIIVDEEIMNLFRLYGGS